MFPFNTSRAESSRGSTRGDAEEGVQNKGGNKGIPATLEKFPTLQRLFYAHHIMGDPKLKEIIDQVEGAPALVPVLAKDVILRNIALLPPDRHFTTLLDDE